MHIARTRDFRDWQYRGTVFTEQSRPAYATSTSNLWAPDVRYIDGRYVMYFTVTDSTLDPSGDDSAIGAAEAPTPEGPWKPTAEPVVEPRPSGNGGFLWTFDPSGFTDVHGNRYLYFGSYFGGVWGTRVSDDGLTATGTAEAGGDRQQVRGLVRHPARPLVLPDGVLGQLLRRTGHRLLGVRGPLAVADGSVQGRRRHLAERLPGRRHLVVTQNGNRWVGAGHNAVLTDHAGRDFLVYHAIDRNKPWLNEPFGINRRPMLIDRLDWVDGWPRVRAGAGPSDSPQPGPVTGSDLGITRAIRWPPSSVCAALGIPRPALSAGSSARARSRSALNERNFRLRLDVSGTRPLTVIVGERKARLVVKVDPLRAELVVKGRHGQRRWTERAAIRPAGPGWRTLSVEATGAGVLVQFGEDDPQAEIRHAVSGRVAAKAPIRFRSRNA